MNFREALMAHLQGEKVEVCDSVEKVWRPFFETFANTPLAVFDGSVTGVSFRLAPRTIIVNGVEVPAPERVAPSVLVQYYYPDLSENCLCNAADWMGIGIDKRRLGRGMVYLSEDDAIARAKAMLLTSDKEDS